MRLALCISGSGSTMDSILNAIRTEELSGIVPALVIASTDQAGGITKALARGISAQDIVILRRKNFVTQEAFGAAILKACQERSIDLIGQYGWLPLTPSNVVKEYEGRIINQHPGPLDPGRPDFGGKGMYGIRVHLARLTFAHLTGTHNFWTEVVAHRVTEEYDQGALLKIKRVPISEHDDAVSLQQRALAYEYAAQIETLRDFARDSVCEITRDHPLIDESELAILQQAKLFATTAYP